MPPHQYAQRTVALIDCLGFKSLIQNSITDSELLERIYSMQTRISAPGSVGNPESVDFKVCHFSDSLIISADNTIAGIWTVLLACRAFYHSVLVHGIFMRGGVTVGNLIHEGNVVFGPALVDVADMEKSLAIYPRIILSRAVVDEAAKKDERWSENYRTLYLKRDSDGVEFIDIFDHPKLEVNTKNLLDTDDGKAVVFEYFHHLARHVEKIITNCTSENILKKYIWFADKLNNYLPDLNDALTERKISPVYISRHKKQTTT